MLRQWLQPAVQYISDAIVADVCNACGRPPRFQRPPRALGRRAALMAAPTHVAAGPVRVVNHPYCGRCISGLIDADSVTALDAMPVADMASRAGLRLPGGLAAVTITAPFITNATLARFVHSIKFSGQRALVRNAAAAMSRACADFQRVSERGWRVAAVPMDPKAQRRRGFNQAEELARLIALSVGGQFHGRALRKLRPTRPQSLTSHSRRLENLLGTFRAEESDGDQVLLVDDLVTTGTTVFECTRALIAAGANAVRVVCLGRLGGASSTAARGRANARFTKLDKGFRRGYDSVVD